MFIRIVLALVLLCSLNSLGHPAFAFSHGRNTTFDCNAWGGSCACFMSAASGKCGNATAHYSNATCNGGDDSAALADWIAYGHGLGATRAVLLIPEGCTEGDFGGDGNASFSADVSIHCAGFSGQPDTTIQNAVIWGYGTTFSSLWFGGQGFFTAGVGTGCGVTPTNTTPLIQSANAGDITVTLVTPGDITGNLAVGDQIVVTALANEGIGSFPPSHSFHEHKSITAINAGTGVLTLSSPLQFSYKSTYPSLGGTSPFEGGPATIYLMEKTYNTVSQYLGMTVTSVTQSNILGKNVTLTDVIWSNPSANGPNPTQSESITLVRNIYPASEVDKEIDNLSILGGIIVNTDIQSSSVNNLVIQGTTFTGHLNGTPTNTTISNSKMNAIRVGPTCCGQASSISLDNVAFASVLFRGSSTAISAYSFSGGTLTIAKSNAEYTNGNSPAIWVPGHKYFAGPGDGSNSCIPANTFTVLDVQDAGANVNILTDLASVSFGNTCSAGTAPPSRFGAYQTMTLIQTNVPAGTPSLTINPEMLPPP